MKIIIAVLMSFFVMANTATALSDKNARELMQRVDSRDDGDSIVARVRLSTYRYAKINGKNAAAEKPRVKLMEFVKKDYGKRGKDNRSISIILEPKSEKGIGFLQYDYEEAGKDTDQWIYLSAFGKVKRIVSGNGNEPKTGSFFGSEFNYEDMESYNIDDFTYKLLGREVYLKKECHIIEALPVPAKAVKSNYSRALLWVDTDDNIILKSLLFNRNGKRNKKIYNRNIEKINGILVPTKVSVINLETKRRTTMVYEKIAINSPVEDDFLTQRTLTDKGFRERRLKRYQKAEK